MKANLNVLPKLKTHLLQGKTITGLEGLRLFGTLRLAEYIRQLRHEHNMNIVTETVKEKGKSFARYSLPKAKKVSRIATRAYMDQAPSRV